MQYSDGRFYVYDNPISRRHSRSAIKWQRMFMRKFDYDSGEQYRLQVEDNPYLGDVFNLKSIVRVPASGSDSGITGLGSDGVLISTIRMGFGHYRIAMAGASAAHAMGFTPYWLDLLAIPGITSEVINWCNSWYSRWSRMSQSSAAFNRWVWEPVTTGDPTLPGLSALLNSWIVGWPWRFLKTNVKDYKMSELFAGLHRAFPPDTPVLTAHMWNCMGAVAGGMTNVVDMMFDNWPMAFQLTEGAKHGVQSPSGYYGFRVMRGFDQRGKILNPVPAEAVHYTGHHVDHELVENVETDCAARVARMKAGEPRRFLLTMGGAGAQRELFRSIVQHCMPLIKANRIALFVNLGDHSDNWEWLKGELGSDLGLAETHFTWEDSRAFTDAIRDGSARGLHIFLHDNTFHAVYTTNYLMRVSDVLITKPSELAFYPVPKIFNERVGGHEKWGAIRGAEIGDGTVETRTVPETLQAIDMLTEDRALLPMYCDQIVKNKSIGIYDGAYRCVELATGRKFSR
ncbi:MAG: hypothetical protein EA427_10270 [Spirochaetaceae bacterium]|nr:MAG: hypothetical protein EA427_10270 [Spirochaetaceae bacterium]